MPGFLIAFLAAQTVPVASAATTEIVVFDDDFDDNRNRWPIGARKHSRLSMHNGRYRFEHTRRDDDWMTWRLVKLSESTDFRIEASFFKQNGAREGAYGLIFEGAGSEAFKSFLVNGDGQFRYGERTKDGRFKTVLGWRHSARIQRGNRARNVLTVRRTGSLLSLLINGTPVGRVEYTPGAGQTIGFQVWNRQVVNIERLQVTETVPDMAAWTPSAENSLVRLDEAFDNNEFEWATGRDYRRHLSVRDGQYVFEHYQTNKDWITWKDVGLQPADDFRIETWFRRRSGAPEHSFGLIFGVADADNLYSFMASADGYYRFRQRRNGRYVPHTGWIKSEALQTGERPQNYLAVQRQGDAILLIINGRMVNRIEATHWPGTGVGFQADRRQRVAIDHVRVHERPPGTARPVVEAVRSTAPVEPSVAQPVLPSPPLVVAIFELEDGSGVLPAATRDQLTEYLSTLLAQKGTYAVVPQAQIRQRLLESKADSYNDCYDESCQIEVGKAVAAQAVLATKLLKVGDACAVTSSLFDLAKEATARAAAADTACDPTALLGAMRKIADRL